MISRLKSVATTLLLIIVTTGGVTTYYVFRHPSTTADSIEFEIVSGTTPLKIATQLAQKTPGIDLPWTFFNQLIFRLYYRSYVLQAGVYLLHPDETLKDWLVKFKSGKPKLFAITLAEGLTLREIAHILAEKEIIADTDSFLEQTTDTEIMTKYHIPATSIEGYFFPSTYYLPRDYGARRVIEKALDEFQKVMQHQPEIFSLSHPYLKQHHDYLTLASIIEKETSVPEERWRISGVFHNRLKKHMRLESDPTTIYGIQNFDGNLVKQHLQTYTPYNTYVIQGLPGGPISNPGLDSIRAAYQPEDHTYFFFVSKNDGTHIFSETYEEHLKYVNQYQRNLQK